MRHKSRNRAVAKVPVSLEAVRALTDLEAQRLGPTMVQFLGALALDDTIAPDRLPVLEFRARMADLVITRAVGLPLERKIAFVQAPGGTGDGEAAKTIAEAHEADARYKLVNEYVGRRPYSEWPEAVKNSVEGASAFAEAEAQEEAEP